VRIKYDRLISGKTHLIKSAAGDRQKFVAFGNHHIGYNSNCRAARGENIGNIIGENMNRPVKVLIPALVIFLIGVYAVLPIRAHAVEKYPEISKDDHQQPTVAVATVTGTPTGPMGTVWSDPEEQINVRSGPGLNYPKVGVLLNRQQVPAIGATPGGSWIQIIYPGVEGGVAWVYAPLLRVDGVLPVVEPPPTPTPQVTPTIDPTLASQFIIELPATRLPTFTAPPPLVIATFPPQEPVTGTGAVPVGFVITGLTVVGIFGLIISILRRR
jgi:hypothetical protein